MENNKRIQFNGILLTICICLLINYVTLSFMMKDKTSINNNQSITIGNTKDKLNINTASKEALMQLSGIGEKKANDIINNRPFNDVWELSRIDGIGETIIRNIEKEVTCE